MRRSIDDIALSSESAPIPESIAGTGSAGHQVAAAFAVGSALVIAAIVLLINADIASRSLFDRPLRGVPEIVAISIPSIVFLTVGQLYVAGGLIRAGLMSRWFDPRSHVIGITLETVFHTTAALLSASILAATWPNLLRAWRDAEFLGVEGDFTAPVWPAKLAVIVGALLVAVFSLRATGSDIGALHRYLKSSVRPARGLAAWIAVCALFALIPVLYAFVDSRSVAGGLSIAVMFVLLYTGMPVAFALMSAAVLGIGAIKGSAAIAVAGLGLAASDAVFSYVFAAVPLFVLMGLIVGAADIGRDSLQAAHWCLRKLKGGLGVATVAANAVFAAITGISIASAAIFSKVAVPPLIEHGFTPRFAVGLVAGSSVLGMLIPPSLLLIIYGLVAEVSINALFVAAIIPGLLLSSVFALTVVVVAWLKPRFAISQNAEVDGDPDINASIAVRKAIPVTVLIVIVLGGIYAGVFTPTEAGAVGSLFAFLIALIMRRVRFGQLARLFFDAAGTSASILFLIVAASAFGMMLTLSGIPGQVGALVADAGLGLTGYALGYLAILIVLGMVLDSTSILLIMVPLAVPAVIELGGNLIWFGIITVIGVEIGLLTPPLGLSVFAIKSALDDQSISLNDIFIGAIPFTLMMLGVTLCLIALPGLSLVLL